MGILGLKVCAKIRSTLKMSRKFEKVCEILMMKKELPEENTDYFTSSLGEG